MIILTNVFIKTLFNIIFSGKKSAYQPYYISIADDKHVKNDNLVVPQYVRNLNHTS